MKKILLIILGIVLVAGCTKDDKANETNADSGETNADSGTSIKIGTQTWTPKNLDLAIYNDGTPIPQVTDPTAWSKLTTGAWCYYANNSANGPIYGKLYNWYAVAGIHDNDPNTPYKILAPNGWHVPLDAELTTLITYLGGESIAGGKMKAATLWFSPNAGANNSSSFTALPGGYCDYNGMFQDIGKYGSWWSSSEKDNDNAWYFDMFYDQVFVEHYSSNKYLGLSVRCLKD